MLLDVPIEGFLVLARNDVPSLGLTQVVVVDRVQKKVLHVPAKSGELHAHVHPGKGYPAYLVPL